MLSGSQKSFEESFIFKGQTVWLETRLIPISDPAGVHTKVLGISRNITERAGAGATSRLRGEVLHHIRKHRHRHDLNESDSTILMANSEFANYRVTLSTALEGKIKWTIFIDPFDFE